MKSIFKKIAFVLAIAMVVTMLPAKAVVAATSDEPQMYSTLRLYLDSGNGEGSDITGTFANERYASVWGWKENGYEAVSFVSEDPSIATVSSKGKVTAVKVGKTTVTATFTGAGKADFTKTCTVTVKQNATRAGLNTSSTKKVTEEGIAVGEEYQLVAVRKDDKGNVVTSGRDVITDGVRFESSDPEIFTVGKTKGKITGVSEGTAKLYVWAVQSEGYDAEADEYPATTEKKEYDVVVKSVMKAEQTAWNRITLTFGTEAEATTARDASLPSVNQSGAAVTEKWEIVKVFKVLNNTNGREQSVYVKDFALDSSEKNKLDLVMFDELDQETDYIVRYMDYEIKISVGSYIADELEIIPTQTYSATDLEYRDSSRVQLGFKLYTTGENGQKVDISGAQKYGGAKKNGETGYEWWDGVEVRDLSSTSNQYHPEYTFDADERIIWFHTDNPGYSVHIRASFMDWYSVTSTTNVEDIKTLWDEEYIYPSSGQETGYTLTNWGITPNESYWTHLDDFSKGSQQYAAEDIGRKLVVELNGDFKSCDAPNGFKFVSANDDKLAINSETGELYPPKEATNGYVLVHVFYNEKYVDSVNIRVWDKRRLDQFTATISNDDGRSGTKLSYNSDPNALVNDTMTVELKPIDQLGEPFTKYMTFQVDLNGVNSSNYVTLEDDGVVGGKLKYSVSVPNGSSLTRNISTFTIVCTATYDDGKATPVVKKYPVIFTAKDTNYAKGDGERSYRLVADSECKMENQTEQIVTISAYSYERDGFKVWRQELRAAHAAGEVFGKEKGAASVTVRLGDVYMNATELTEAANGRDLEFHTIQATTGKLATVVSGAAVTSTGSAIELREYPNLLKRAKVGTYSVGLFIGDGSKAVQRAETSINVIDGLEADPWRWNEYSGQTVVTGETDYLGVLAAIRECFTLGKDNVRSDAIYVGYADENGNLAFANDFWLRGNSLYVNKVRYLTRFEAADGIEYCFEREIEVNRTVRVNVLK